MFFDKIVSYTCDICMELKILNKINIYNYPNALKKSLFPCNLFLENFKTLKFSYDLGFHQIHLKNMYLHKGKYVVLVHKIWKKLHDFKHSLLLFLKRCNSNTRGKHPIMNHTHLHRLQIVFNNILDIFF
jgi:hypothetical protein